MALSDRWERTAVGVRVDCLARTQASSNGGLLLGMTTSFRRNQTEPSVASTTPSAIHSAAWAHTSACSSFTGKQGWTSQRRADTPDDPKEAPATETATKSDRTRQRAGFMCVLTFDLTCGRRTAKPSGKRQVERRVRRHRVPPCQKEQPLTSGY